jgi:NADH dehydrogenase/NADH:ubiquinone oxidoreductase subunit G
MQLYVDTPLVKKARKCFGNSVIKSPLDCQYDQGGECDLQDQTTLFGSDYSHFL